MERAIGPPFILVLLYGFTVLISTAGRIALVLALAVMILGTARAFVRRIVISSTGIEYRDAFGRVKAIGYSEVSDVVRDPYSVMVIVLKSGVTITYPGKGRSVDQAVAVIRSRIDR